MNLRNSISITDRRPPRWRGLPLFEWLFNRMRAHLVAIAFLFIPFTKADDRNPIRLETALGQHWTVVRVSHYHFMGDFDREYPVIFFQMLPDNRILISHAVQHRWKRLIPKPVRIIERGDLERIKARILEHFSIAHQADPESHIKPNALGSDFHSIEVSVTGDKTEEFARYFNPADNSSERFRKFLESLTH